MRAMNRAPLAVAALPLLALFACASITGLSSDYVEVDCVADCGAPTGHKDGGPPPPPPSDANPPQVCTPIGAPSPLDAGVRDAGDAGDGGADAAACPPPMSGTCSPGNVTGLQPAWKPPKGPPSGQCTTTQMTSYFSQCQSASSTVATCTSWRTANATCGACLESRENDAKYGAVIYLTNGVTQINVPGCIALLEPCNLTCAEEYQAALTCESAACEPTCPVGTDPASLTAYQNCTGVADGCGCAAFASAATTCSNQIKGPLHPAASVCLDAPDFQTYFNQVAPVFCGNAP
jgi:hypothetical protein